jgi:hypothetical protein
VNTLTEDTAIAVARERMRRGQKRDDAATLLRAFVIFVSEDVTEPWAAEFRRSLSAAVLDLRRMGKL